MKQLMATEAVARVTDRASFTLQPTACVNVGVSDWAAPYKRRRGDREKPQSSFCAHEMGNI